LEDANFEDARLERRGEMGDVKEEGVDVWVRGERGGGEGVPGTRKAILGFKNEQHSDKHSNHSNHITISNHIANHTAAVRQW
jgi:hypothetical protein